MHNYFVVLCNLICNIFRRVQAVLLITLSVYEKSVLMAYIDGFSLNTLVCYVLINTLKDRC